MEISSFFNAKIQSDGTPDRVYTADIFAKYFASFIGNGVFPNPSTGLQILSQNDMTIVLKCGKAWINGYYYENTSDLILKLDPADGVLKRIDRVVLRLDFFNREITCKVKKGTFASNPVTQALQRDADAYELCIAEIKVDAGAISILQSNITDTRLNSELCGIVTQTVKTIDTTELYRQLQAYITEHSKDFDSWLQSMKTHYEEDFNNWFDTIKGVLDGDTAGNLANQILDLKKRIENIDLTATKVNLVDEGNYFTSSNVEGALSELASQINGQRLRGIEIANSLVSKLDTVVRG
jgi:hypothetical protein